MVEIEEKDTSQEIKVFITKLEENKYAIIITDQGKDDSGYRVTGFEGKDFKTYEEANERLPFILDEVKKYYKEVLNIHLNLTVRGNN